MNRGGYLKIDESGVLSIAEEQPPTDLNPFRFHVKTTFDSGKLLKRFQCISYPTKHLTGNADTMTVHGEPTLFSDGKLAQDSLWEIKTLNDIAGTQDYPQSWVALFHVESQLYFVIKPNPGTSADGPPPLEFYLGSKDDAVDQAQGAFLIKQIE